MNNRVKEKLRSGQRVLGTFVETGSPTVVECLGRTGLDFVVLDNEHSPVEAETTRDMVRAAEAVGLTPLARVRELSRPAILKLLDVGVQGLIIPDIHTAAEVEKLLQIARFFPEGKRGFCPTRKDGWGFDAPGGIEERMAYFNEQVLLMPQCETADALACIEDIAALKGVDGIFIGPFDLSIDMGIPGAFEHPDFQAALQRITRACHKEGKPCLIFAGDGETARQRFLQGYDGVALSMDTAQIITAFRNAVTEALRK